MTPERKSGTTRAKEKFFDLNEILKTREHTTVLYVHIQLVSFPLAVLTELKYKKAKPFVVVINLNQMLFGFKKTASLFLSLNWRVHLVGVNLENLPDFRMGPQPAEPSWKSFLWVCCDIC